MNSILTTNVQFLTVKFRNYWGLYEVLVHFDKIQVSYFIQDGLSIF